MRYLILLLLFACDEIIDKNRPYVDLFFVGQKTPFAQCKTFYAGNLEPACGMRASDCTSGREYYCLQNIEVRKTDEKTK